MPNKTRFVLLSAFAALALAMIACNGGQVPALTPTAAAIPPTKIISALTESAAPTPSGQSPALTGLDGNWDGKNPDGNQVSYTVENSQVTYIMLNYSVVSNGCSLGGAVINRPKDGLIRNNGFSIEFTDDDGRLFTFAGSFNSDTEAVGTIHVKGTQGSLCGEFETNISWTANSPAPAGGTNPTATVAAIITENAPPTSASAADDPVAVVNGFFNAINSGNVNAALVFVDDTVIYSFGNSANSIGKGGLKSYLASLTKQGLTFTLSNYVTTGSSIVKFAAQASDGASYPASQAMLNDGRIVILTLK